MFKRTTINGDPFSLRNSKGQLVVLKFWGTYRVQCVEEAPLLKKLYAQYKDQRVTVVGISLDKDTKPVHEMVTSKGMSWPQVSDADKKFVSYLMSRHAHLLPAS